MPETDAPRPVITDAPLRRPASALIYPVVGALVWICSAPWSWARWDLALLWLGALVHTSLAFDLAREKGGRGLNLLAMLVDRTQLAAAILLGIALLGPVLDFDAVSTRFCVFAWLAFTALGGALGLWRLLSLGVRGPGVFADAGMIFLAGSGVWATAMVMEHELMGFVPFWAGLTSAHQLFAGLVLQVVASRIVAARPVKVAWIAAIVITLFNPMIAAGITIRNEGGPVWPEVAAAVVYACAVIVLGWVQLFHALAPSSRLPWYSRVLLVIADLSLGTAMTLAIIYAYGTWRGYPTMTIPQMVTWHATLNVFGFGLCGLLGWTLATRRTPVAQ